jgi:serine/threonine-protein kinase
MTVESRSEPEVLQFGPFRVLRRLASCGAREAFLAVDGADRRVVLKALSAPQSDDGLLDLRIADEATSYARLSNPNLVKVVELFSSGGRLLIALEHIEGSTLNVVRAALARGQHKLDDACWYYVASCIFAGLAAAHAAIDAGGQAAPILHRNVNPSNVHVGWDGAIKLGDFGVASIVEATRDSNPGLTWGGYGYLAPEQANAQPIGPHTDVYSATLVLWELLTGRKAVERAAEPATDLLDRMAAPSFPSLDELRPDIDPAVREVVRTGLLADPSKRSVDAARVCEVLRNATDMENARQRFATALAGIRSEKARPSGTAFVAGQMAPAAPAPPPAASKPTAPGVAGPRHPPPLPPRCKAAQKPPLPVRPTPIELELDIEPDPDSTPPTTHSEPEISGTSTVVRSRPKSIARLPMLVAGVLVAGMLVAGVAIAFVVPRGSANAARLNEAPVKAAIPETLSPPTERLSPPKPEPTAAAQTPTAPAPDPSTEAPAEPPSAPTPDTDLIPRDLGELQMPSGAAGHRIFVDGRTAGEGATPIRVPCGPHTVRIGSAGRVQHIDVPCGSALPLAL